LCKQRRLPLKRHSCFREFALCEHRNTEKYLYLLSPEQSAYNPATLCTYWNRYMIAFRKSISCTLHRRSSLSKVVLSKGVEGHTKSSALLLFAESPRDIS
jgi:hypothetical protein